MGEMLLEQVALAIGRAEGYVSKPVMRKRFKVAAEAALAAIFEPLSDDDLGLDWLRAEGMSERFSDLIRAERERRNPKVLPPW